MLGGWRERAGVAALLAVLAAQLAHGLRADGLTNDEVLYIAAGWRHLTLRDHSLNPTHPPLASEVAALGLLPLAPRTPAWSDGDDPLSYSYRFVHVENDASAVIPRARAPVALMTLALALLCWAWAREAGGPAAGLAALALFCFHPSLLAHGHLATTDLPAAFWMLVASWLFWRWCRRPSALGAAGIALALGAGAATRLSAWVLAPCLAVLALARIVKAPAGERRRRAAETGVLLAAALIAVPLVVWAAYGFRAPVAHLMPAPYLEGLKFQVRHNRAGHLAYLLGERSRSGWPYYFLVALLVKSTPGFLLGLVAAVVALRGRDGARKVAPHWLLPALGTFAAVSAGHIQIGERYLLPFHAYLVPLIGCVLAAWMRDGRRWGAAAVTAALALHVVPAAAANRQGHLAYFNLLAGGTPGGHRVLLDSNLDWGQDLPRLADWMRRHGVASVQLAYMGADDPARFGIAHEDLPGRRLHPERRARAIFDGTVVVSPNLVFGLVPALAGTYAPLRERPPDDRAGVFFVYRMGGGPS